MGKQKENVTLFTVDDETEMSARYTLVVILPETAMQTWMLILVDLCWYTEYVAGMFAICKDHQETLFEEKPCFKWFTQRGYVC